MLKGPASQVIRDFERRAEALGLQMKALHDIAACHHSTWGRWRAGTTKPEYELLRRLDSYLDGVAKATAAAKRAA